MKSYWVRNLLFWIAVLVACCRSTYAADVSMAFGNAIPPYSFPDSNSGIELEVIGEALAFKGHKLRPQYFPLARVPRAFVQGQVDAAMTDMGKDLSALGGYYADPAILYDNVFISLRERKLVIREPKDLEGLSIISFQGGLKRYPLWLTAVKKAGNYHETSKQNLQVLTLFAGRYDLVLSDKSIFKYFALQLIEREWLYGKPFQMHEVFEIKPSDYRPIFRSHEIRDDFNAGLKYLKESGRYHDIYHYYLKE